MKRKSLMALTDEEKTALDTLTGDIAQIAVELYSKLLYARAKDNTNFDMHQAFELTKILTAYAVNGVDEA